jgi:hypothetical protein
MRPHALLPLLAAIAMSAVSAAPSQAAQFWVGSGTGCTHATLQGAVDTAQATPGPDFVFLVGPGPFDGPVSIIGGGLTIVGGIGICTDVNSSGYSTLRAPSGSRPLSILIGGSSSVILKRLRITTQQGTLNNDGGAIWFSGGGLASGLVLDDCQVLESVALGDGGGIYVSNATLQVEGFSQISGNAAANGGGIAADAGARVSVYEGSQVSGNTAFFDGGGLHLVGANVQLGMTSRGFSGGPVPPPLVVNNIAGDEGGGMYLADTALASFVIAGAGSPPVGIGGNQARRGGGIFLSNAALQLERAELYFNQAAEDGGGVCVVAQATLTAAHTSVASLLAGGYPHFTGNDALRGGSLFVDRGVVALGSGSVFDHDAGAGDATVSAIGTSTLALHGVVFSRNQAPALIALKEGVQLALTHVSMGGNQAAAGLVDWQGTLTGVQVAASAFDETEPFFARFGTPQNPPTFQCIVSRHGSTFNGVPVGTDLSGVLFADPGFLSPQDGDLHIRPGSAAIDRCPDLTDSTHDVDGELRGFDFDGPATPGGQLWDAGADEHTSFPGRYFTVSPCRAIDTRQPGQGPSLGNGDTRRVLVREACGIPFTARAIALNVTAVAPTSAGHLTLYPAGVATPGTSTISIRSGVTRANNAVIALSPAGALEARATLAGGKVHFIVDVSGYFE